jgi:putative hemolysin
MDGVWPQLLLVGALVIANGILSGSEIAFISLRETQLARLERRGGAGRLAAGLARRPNRFLATIQIGITLAGFLASAAAAVTLAGELEAWFGVFGDAADSAAIVAVTLVLSYVTLVLGELAPKRLALQWAERWALIAARPLHWMSIATKPVVWLLGVSTDFIVRTVGGKPGATRDEVDLEELREMVIAHRALSEDHQEVLVGAFEVAERTLREILIPRPRVFSLDAGSTVEDGLQALLGSGHSRAPVVVDGDLDGAIGIAHLRDLVMAEPGTRVGDHVSVTSFLPESVPVLTALRRMQELHQQMAFVVEEFGGIDGIITVEDMVEELVGEIYDETDRDVLSAERRPDGSITVPGSYPIHDLVDLGIEVVEGDYTTVSGLVLAELGRLPDQPGDRFTMGDWELTVLSVRGRSIGQVRFSPLEAAGEKR